MAGQVSDHVVVAFILGDASKPETVLPDEEYDFEEDDRISREQFITALEGVEDRTVWDSIRPLRCRATHPQIEDCAVSVRLQRLVEDRDRFENLCDFTDAAVSHSGSVPHILQVITRVALPFLKSFNTLEDVRTFVHSERAHICTIREPAKAILSRI